jgi:hypothetical protein
VDSRGPVPVHAGRKPEQLDAEIGLDLLSQPRGDDREAGLGPRLLVGGGEGPVIIQGHLPGRRVPEPPLGAEEAVLGHPRQVGSAHGHAHHRPPGNVLDLEPRQPLTVVPGPEHP